MIDWKECKEKIIDTVVKNLNIATTYEEALKSWKSCMDEYDGTPSSERLAGQREAWELAYKIYMMSPDKQKECFGKIGFKHIAEGNTYAEAAEKVKAWEDRKKFEVGDVVRRDELYGVVTGFVGNTYCVVITQYGFRESWYISECTKTGRTLPVEDWLRQIGGEE